MNFHLKIRTWYLLLTFWGAINLNGNISFSSIETLPTLFENSLLRKEADEKLTDDTDCEVTVSFTQYICEGSVYIFNDIIFNSSGVYVDTLTTIQGCDSIIYLELIISPTLYYSFSDEICEGWNYFFGNHVLNTAGTYSDTLTGSTGCDSIVTLNLTVKDHINISLGEDTILCEGNTLTLDAVGYETYRWSTGDTTESIQVHTSDRYTLSVTDESGCSASDDILVSFISTPHANVESDITICVGEPVMLRGSGGDRCFWLPTPNFPGTTACDTIDFPMDTTIYQLVVLNQLQSMSCTDTAQLQVNVNSPPHIDLVPDTTICSGCPVNLVEQLVDCEECQCIWTGINDTQLTNCNPLVNPVIGTDYVAMITDKHGCKDTASVTIRIEDMSTSVLRFPEKVIDIFPNPARNSFGITGLENNTDTRIKFYSLAGKLLYMTSGYAKEIDISSLENGFYLVVIESEGNFFRQKLLKI
ncbi:MAG: T9SS type A sorting domain-containing protein [Saprospiraceae bacterium]|nr:T9SS type A sorting domain-containing protein [Saprospiraceae bacterium]